MRLFVCFASIWNSSLFAPRSISHKLKQARFKYGGARLKPGSKSPGRNDRLPI